MCFSEKKCRKSCPRGQSLDPREFCTCVFDFIIDELYKCDPLAIVPIVPVPVVPVSIVPAPLTQTAVIPVVDQVGIAAVS